MGIHYQTQAQGRIYTVVDDLHTVYVAVLTGVLLDEVTGTPLQTEAVITASIPGLITNLGNGSQFGLAGYPEQLFPKLATTAYPLTLTVEAAGYRTFTLPVTVPAGATFPIALAAIKMRPLPVRIQGRIVRESDRSAITGAKVASGNGKVLLLRSPLVFDHALGVTVNAVTLTTAGPMRKLTVEAKGGSKSIMLDNTAALAAPGQLQIGAGASLEVVTIASLGPDPAQVNLTGALNATFPVATQVQEASAALVSVAASTRRANAGDGLVVVNPALTADALEIVDGAKTEYHWLNAISNSSGYYHLNGMTGVVSLDLQASASGLTQANSTWFLVFQDPVNVVDFRLKP
jgi:hypothetical protein